MNRKNYKTPLIIREDDFYSSKFYKKAHGIFGRKNSTEMFKSFRFLNEYASSLRTHNNKKLDEKLYSSTRNPFKSFDSDEGNTRDNTPNYSENSSCNKAPKISLKKEINQIHKKKTLKKRRTTERIHKLYIALEKLVSEPLIK